MFIARSQVKRPVRQRIHMPLYKRTYFSKKSDKELISRVKPSINIAEVAERIPNSKLEYTLYYAGTDSNYSMFNPDTKTIKILSQSAPHHLVHEIAHAVSFDYMAAMSTPETALQIYDQKHGQLADEMFANFIHDYSRTSDALGSVKFSCDALNRYMKAYNCNLEDLIRAERLFIEGKFYKNQRRIINETDSSALELFKLLFKKNIHEFGNATSYKI